MKFFLSLTFFSACLSAQAAPRVATSDWSVAETLTAMGRAPISVGDKTAYKVWINYPPMPPQTQDSGLRFQPNLEQLYQNKPDMFIQSPWFSHLKPQFEKIAPVHEVSFTSKDQKADYASILNATRQIGRIIGDRAGAEKLIADTERKLSGYKRTLAPFSRRPLAVIQFIDARNARIYGKTNLYQTALDKLNLRNAWQGSLNEWGFTNIALTELAKLPPDTLLVIVQPHPANVRSQLEKSTLWRRLPFSRPENRRVLPPVWGYGGLSSMEHFARRLAETLPSGKEAAW